MKKYQTIEKEDINKALTVLQIEKSVRQIIRSEGELFSTGGQVGHRTVAYKIQNDCTFYTLDNFFKNPNLVEEIAVSFPQYILNPYISLFINKLRDIFVMFADIDTHENHDALVTTRIGMLNSLVESIRSEVKS